MFASIGGQRASSQAQFNCAPQLDPLRLSWNVYTTNKSSIRLLMLSSMRRRILSLPRFWKRALLVSYDFTALALALWASFSLRFDRWTLPASLDEWLIVAS